MSLLLVLIIALVVFVLVCILIVLQSRLRYSTAIHTWEIACGLGAALIGCFALAYVLFGPIYQFESSSGQSRTENMLQVGISPTALLALGGIALGFICVGISAVAHSRTGVGGWRIILWVATLFLFIMTFLTGFSIGIFLFPGTLLALFASASSLGIRRAALD